MSTVSVVKVSVDKFKIQEVKIPRGMQKFFLWEFASFSRSKLKFSESKNNSNQCI